MLNECSSDSQRRPDLAIEDLRPGGRFLLVDATTANPSAVTSCAPTVKIPSRIKDNNFTELHCFHYSISIAFALAGVMDLNNYETHSRSTAICKQERTTNN